MKVTDAMNFEEYADGCPWKNTEFMKGVGCSGTYISNGIARGLRMCKESNCAPYHFIKKLMETRGKEVA